MLKRKNGQKGGKTRKRKRGEGKMLERGQTEREKIRQKRINCKFI